MKKLIGYLIAPVALGFSLAACAAGPVGRSHTERVSPPHESPEIVSMVAVLANPDQFDGKKVTLSGVLSLEFEDVSLYRDRDAYEYVSVTDGFILELSEEQVESAKGWQGQRVVVTGRFHRDRFWGSFPGRLRDIERVIREPKRGEYRRVK